MALSAEDTARLAQLKAAQDKLLAGTATARARDASGREVEYAKADLGQLGRTIEALEAQAVSRSGRRRGAIRFFVR